MRNSWKPDSTKNRFHELEHESKMRLVKIHSHTSERRDYEANKERQEQKERKGAHL